MWYYNNSISMVAILPHCMYSNFFNLFSCSLSLPPSLPPFFSLTHTNNMLSLPLQETTGAPEGKTKRSLHESNNYWTQYYNNTSNKLMYVGASTASVSVSVTDYNDETPEFISSSLSSSVAEEAPFGTTVTTLRVWHNYYVIACSSKFSWQKALSMAYI